MKISKIMLIQPPAFTLKDKSDMNPNVPLGIAYIAAVLERRGYDVRLVDAFMEGLDNEREIDDERVLIGLGPDEIEARIRQFSPDIVGISSLFTLQRKNAHAVARIAKRINSGIITVMGGPHPSAEPEMVLQDNAVDFIVLGEGEDAMLELVKHLEEERGVSDIDGLGFRTREGAVVINEKKKFIADLDSIPFPARHLLPMEKYFRSRMSHGLNRESSHVSILTSRGCPFQCTFCSTHKVWSRKYRTRSAANVLAEIKHLIDTYGVKELLFEDDNMLMDKIRAHEIFDGMIEQRYDLAWRTPNGVAIATLDEELLDKMKRSGCYQMGIGVESGNRYVLDNIIKKPVDLKKVRRIVKYARKIGIETILFLVVGMPGESLEQMRDSFRFARSLGLYEDQHISIATPYPGSELYDICKSRGYFKKGFDYDRLLMRTGNIDTQDWTAEDVMNLVREEQKKNHLHCLFTDPVLFLKALVPDRIKFDIKRRLGYRKSEEVYLK